MKLNRRNLLSSTFALGATALVPNEVFGQSASTGPAFAPVTDPMSHVNPEFRETLTQLLKTVGPLPTMSTATLPQMRKFGASWAKPVLPSPAIREVMIPGAPGSPKVRVLVTGDTAGASKPAVLHIHGGGYVSGSADAEKRNIQDLSLAHSCVVVTVDYRLAPETQFPGSLNDNYAALKWLHDNAASLGVDTSRIAVKGESAGGGHAAALVLAARDRGEIPICCQILIYPMLDDRTGSTNQLPPIFGYYTWTKEANQFGWTSLLGVPAGSPNVPKGAVPARVADVSGLPPTFIGVGSIDLFAPEDMEFARRLALAGVSTELHVVPGGFHGFDGIVENANLSRSFAAAWNDALKRAFTKA